MSEVGAVVCFLLCLMGGLSLVLVFVQDSLGKHGEDGELGDEVVISDAAFPGLVATAQLPARVAGRNVFFVHVPKTGGTSLSNAAREALGARFVGNVCGSTKFACRRAVPPSMRGQCVRRGLLFSQEILSDRLVWQWPDQCKTQNTTVFFSLVRDPVSWIISAYGHCIRLRGRSYCGDNITQSIQRRSFYFTRRPFQSSFLGSLLRRPEFPLVLCRTECYSQCLLFLNHFLRTRRRLRRFRSNVFKGSLSYPESAQQLRVLANVHFAEDVGLYAKFQDRCFLYRPK
mmetsp:Transcript_31472/g.88291  ORF Transcript_31472/g.88291 Transcript_31472/m.88291 type:complete len:286 (+) Transcript_31472:101-958(+)|eukprot:CAMPEP_0119141970 /NCGR_PEP_ID=MMETSP1310-20130426/31877_1 /TAXON_ID=464262 /ORGANISM="Genus nov. species nov., Strain RCC2339" /LENGTH=285 /DNA_ID=CAMNT_0007133471 /DNA_START=225 /DNA_END=1082 /DNA_ORIENTATION=+